MYPLQQNEEKCFQISFNPHQHIISEDLILGSRYVSLDGHNNYALNNSAATRTPRRRPLSNLDDLHATGTTTAAAAAVSDQHDSQIKMMHRQRERQRRQEMGALYMSLRALLPLEFIKGKRAISDQMNGAVNYIKHQKKKIKEIEAKRDELKKMYNNTNSIFEKSRGQLTPIGSFKISSFHGGLEIIITTNSFHGFPLSRILKVVVEQGLEVINCGSTIVNDKSIHTIQIEVSDSTSLDLPQLGKKLTEAVPLLSQVTD